ncbi:MAG: undecaprenyldiphospho-muramoylpentapeptide beta-N-acetylglucosaminyltransferase [Acidimicrobiia bacterium]|nr:MAG: undecaprenyldiphospho-muramoylpentapeptide beta-N-acetylglucosaminyltransferase [Acidimicrobiia bacterium]
MTFAFAAAGTGGHLVPAIAVATELVRRGVSVSDIVFFGGERLESTAVPEAGFELVRLDIRGLARSLSLRNFGLPLMIRRAARTIKDELTRRDRGVLTAFGGYVTIPAGLGASSAGYPIVIHEQNAVPGLANRVATRRAARTLVAFPATVPRLIGAELTGNPLAEPIVRYDPRLRNESIAGYGLDPDQTVLGVFGGSQGAAALNEQVVGFARGILDSGCAIVHVTGPNNHDAVAARAIDDPNWVTVPYERHMERFYAASDLVLSRAGALTISELTATGTPAVVVPLPAGRGYQGGNAAEMEAAGGCLIVDQDDLSTLPDLLTGLLADQGRRNEMAVSAAMVGRPAATATVTDVVLEVANG